MNRDVKLLNNKHNEKSLTMVALYILVSVNVVISLIAIYKSYSAVFSEEVTLVSCPKSTSLDNPITLRRVRATAPKEQQMWVRSFARKYITFTYPRTKADVIPFLNYLETRSRKDQLRKVKSLKRNLDEYTALIDSNQTIKFYPKSSSDLRMRLTNSGSWIVELDGYFVIDSQMQTIRKVGAVRLEVEVGEHTPKNPEGLYVISANSETILDVVSGERD